MAVQSSTNIVMVRMRRGLVEKKQASQIIKATLGERSPALNRKVLVSGYKKCGMIDAPHHKK